MDVERAVRFLRDWAELAENERDVQGDWFLDPSRGLAVLLEQADSVGRIVRQVLQLPTTPVMCEVIPGGPVGVGDGVILARRAAGSLELREEVEEFLGPMAPSYSPEAFHESVWRAAEPLWLGRHYRAAVHKAATFLSAEVSSRLGRNDLTDVALMREAFADTAPAPGRARLRWPGEASDLKVRSMREALRSFSVGCYTGIRNLAAHATDEMDEQEALEQMASLSMLARWIDHCEVVTSD